jgi:hypothetical protein
MKKYKLPAGSSIRRRTRTAGESGMRDWEDFVTTRDVTWTSLDLRDAIKQGWGFYDPEDPTYDRIRFRWDDIER